MGHFCGHRHHKSLPIHEKGPFGGQNQAWWTESGKIVLKKKKQQKNNLSYKG